MDIGMNIKKYRKLAGMTQVELAAKLGTTQKVITNYERGANNPTARKVPELAKTLGVSLDELYGVQESRNTPPPKRSKRMSKLVDIFNELSATHQRALLQQAEGLVLRAQQNGNHAPTT